MPVRDARERWASIARAEPLGRVLVHHPVATALACIPVLLVPVAAAAPAIGQSASLVHSAYQLVAVAAVGAMLWLLWRRTRNPAVLAFVGLHPLLAVSVVNGGHPDALVALGVLAGLLLAIERRPVLAGLAFAFAASV